MFSGWRDADHRVRFTVETYGAADDRRISGEPPPPQAMAEDDETRVARTSASVKYRPSTGRHVITRK